MENRNDYEEFIINRLRALINTINRKFLTTLDLIEETSSKDYSYNQFDGIILLKNQTLFYIVIRTRIKTALKHNLSNRDSNVPIVVLSENKFVLIKDKVEEELDISKLENIIMNRIKSDIEKNIESIKHNIFIELSQYFLEKKINFPF